MKPLRCGKNGYEFHDDDDPIDLPQDPLRLDETFGIVPGPIRESFEDELSFGRNPRSSDFLVRFTKQ